MAVYFIQPCVLIGTNRYKIGRTNKKNFNRMKSYGKGTKIISFNHVNNPISTELLLINKFNKKYKLIKGKEYFEGNFFNMIDDYLKIIYKNNLENKNINDTNDKIFIYNIIKIQKYFKNIYLRKLYKIKNKNASIIQNYYKKNIYLKKIKSAIIIQNYYKKYISFNFKKYIEDTYDIIENDREKKKDNNLLKLNDIYSYFKEHKSYNGMIKKDFTYNLLQIKNIEKYRKSNKRYIIGLKIKIKSDTIPFNIKKYIKDTYDIIENDREKKKDNNLLKLNDIYSYFKEHKSYNGMIKKDFTYNLLQIKNIEKYRKSNKRYIIGLKIKSVSTIQNYNKSACIIQNFYKKYIKYIKINFSVFSNEFI